MGYYKNNKPSSSSPGIKALAWAMLLATISVAVTLISSFKYAKLRDLPTPTGTDLVSIFKTGTATQNIAKANTHLPVIASSTSTRAFTTDSSSIPSATATSTFTPTSTFTNTPNPTTTFTPLPTIDPKNFRGFDKNCIDQKYWTLGSNQSPAPTYKQNAKICYNLTERSINSQNEGLRLNGSPLVSPVFGMYTEIPPHTDVDIKFKLKIDKFILTTNSIDGILVLGVSDITDVDFTNGEYLFHAIRPAYQTSNVFRDIGTNKIETAIKWGSGVRLGETYNIVFSIRGIDLFIYINDKTIESYYPRSLSRFNNQLVFWVGYQLPVGKSNLQASITEFSITEK